MIIFCRPSTSHSPGTKKDDRNKRDRKNDRNKNFHGPNVIKSSGVFSEGNFLTELKTTKYLHQIYVLQVI